MATTIPLPFAQDTDRFRTNDIYIAIAAPSSKTRLAFVKSFRKMHDALGLAEDANALEADEYVPRFWTCEHKSRRIHLIELPIFNNDVANPSNNNVDALRTTASLLAAAYIPQLKASIVRGVIFLGTPEQVPLVLKGLLGIENITFEIWDESQDCYDICAPFLDPPVGPKLPIQEELVDKKLELIKTTAGDVINNQMLEYWACTEDQPELHDLLGKTLGRMHIDFDGLMKTMEDDENKPGVIRIQRQETPQDRLEKWNKNPLSWGLKIQGFLGPLPRPGSLPKCVVM
jgi:hypothetical protein